MINVRLDWPPTINTYYTVSRGRKILSQKGRKYKESAIKGLMLQETSSIEGRIEVSIDAYPPDRRKRDLDNIVKPVLDVVTNFGIWGDDSQVDILRVRRMSVESPGHVRVHISRID